MYSPTDFTEFTELLAEIVLPQISRIYTEVLAECFLPQISQNSQNFLLRLFSHRFHRSTQIVWVPSRGCTCLRSALPLARASAPSEVGRFCEFCAICGSHFAVEGVSKLASVTPRRDRSTCAEDSSGGILPPQLQSNSHRWHGCNFRKGVKTQLTRAESPTSHSPGQRPGYNGIYNEQCAL